MRQRALTRLSPNVEKARRRRVDEIILQITPLRICAFDQRKFPGAPPFLDFLLTRNRGRHFAVLFEPDEARAAILPRKPVDQAFAMLMGALDEIARDAKVERAIALTRHEIDGDEIEPRHAPAIAHPCPLVIPGHRVAMNPEPRGECMVLCHLLGSGSRSHASGMTNDRLSIAS